MLGAALRNPGKKLEPSIQDQGLNVHRLETILLNEVKRFAEEPPQAVLASLEETILTQREEEVIRRNLSCHPFTRLC